MSAGGRKARRVAGSLFGAVLAVGAASAGMVGLSSTVASATTAGSTTVTIEHAVKSPVTIGEETQDITGTLVGHATDGYPATGTVTVVTSGGTTVCTGSIGGGSGDTEEFNCTVAASALAAGTYTVHAHYSGGTSSVTGFTYPAGTSGTQTLRVTNPETSSIILNPITSTVAHGAESQTFTGTVTGHSTDGYPATGTVKVVTSGGTTLCTGSWTSGADDAAGFTCDASTPSKLAASGTPYVVEAQYAGGTSSSPSFHYNASVSPTQDLTVTAATSETPTVSLDDVTSPVGYGSEDQTFRGTVTGVSGDGYPSTGAVSVRTSTGVVLCTGSLTSGSDYSAGYTCEESTDAKLSVGGYSVHAHYTGGASSDVSYTYAAVTSGSQTLTVTSGVPTTTTLALDYSSRTDGDETSEVLSVTVTGRSGDGYPRGTVTVRTTGDVTVCSTSTRVSGTSDYSHFDCSPGASELGVGTYELTATFSPSSPSSSTTGVTYAASTSTREELTVTSGVATSSTLSLKSPSERSGDETSEVFTVTVTGTSGDGYPKGTVKVKTTAGTSLCTKSTATTDGTYTATYTCSPGASVLGAGSYTVEATYTPSTPSSSVTSIGYTPSTSSSQTLTVTAATATRIYGATADATAAAELESVYPDTSGDCPGSSSSRPVVLATDEHYPDALAASYLEKWLGTGMLLTPTASMTDATLTALRVEGITTVYVVGGPLAVSASVVSDIEDTYAYDCGGTTRSASHISVVRIYGTTQYTTAEDIAKRPGSSFVGSVDLQDAYGMYNDTDGKSSAAPAAGAKKTAILASGAEFQDAEASATLAYAAHLPLLLTTPTALSSQALSAITTLGVTQVILMGGPLAVSNAVVTALVAHKVSVLRVAGADYTDTATQLADLELGSSSAHEGFGWSPTGGVTVTQGHSYTDGLAGAIVAAHGGATGSGPQPMLLTESPTSAGSYLADFLAVAGSRGIDGDGSRVTSLTVLGGPLAVSTAVVSSLEADL